MSLVPEPASERAAPVVSAVGLAKTLEAMVQRLADRPENHLAFEENGQVVRKSFPEVLADVEAARDRLAAGGLRPGMRVGILATNSYAWVVHDLALIQLGVTSVAFPDETPTAELGRLFERYALSLLLASSDLLPPYPTNQPIVFLDRPTAGRVTVREVATPPEPEGAPADAEPIPSIVFSSGSSGRLKALKTSGTGTLAVIEHYCSRYTFYRDDTFLVFLPLHSYQQRLMIYGCINYGVNLAVVKTGALFAGLKQFQPTLCLAPPILFESVQKQFEEALRGQPWARRAAFHTARSLSRVAPGALAERLRKICYGRLRESFGGRMRLMWTGMAPVRPATLRFFADTGLPLVEGYGLTESGPIAFNTLEENRIGSAGKPIVPGSVRLAEDGEIVVERAAFLTSGYFEADPADTAATYLGPGRIATGDIGRFDADGFLYLQGRKKEIIITGDGNKVHPELLEGHLERSPLILQAVVFGQGLPCLAVLLVVRREAEDRAAVLDWVAEVNRQLPHGIRIEKTHLTTEQFSRENGLLTENLKLNRRAILNHYRDRLSA